MATDEIQLNYKAATVLSNSDYLGVKNIQFYNPIYNNFFILNENNNNEISLNQPYDILSVIKKFTYNTYLCLVKKNNETTTKEVFIKFAPIVDPIKYMVGKYNFDEKLFKLPEFNNKNVNNKIQDTNNCAYTDGFFVYLTSKLLEKFNFINGTTFYNSYLANHENMKINIYEDIDFLNESDEFHKNKKIHFNVDESFYDELSNYDSKDNKKKINITDTDEELCLNILDVSCDLIQETQIINMENLPDISLNDIIITDKSSVHSSISGSSCSSRTSYTNSGDEDENSDNESECSEESYESSEEEEEEEQEIFAYIKDFPVNLIFMEKCVSTLDSYMSKNDIEEGEWESILLQVIFTLITYQKVFDFTHNDLHTNNIMYVDTDKQYIYYGFNGKTYKVPTYGKVWKIIDFGRAIYKFKGKTMFSDSFSPEGDAATQFNCEPYFNKEKKIVNPNKSFDLCRFGCSLFDYFIDNITMIKEREECDNLQSLILEWCSDDSDKNVLYKNNGEERYPEFKLYKMITRSVHNHIPEKQLERIMFDKYKVSKKKLNKKTKIINIDKFPVCV